MITALIAMAMSDLTDQVSADRLRATVEKLASFHTRNTLSPTLNDAAKWLASEFEKIPGVKVELMTYTLPKSRRVPEDKQVVQVVATLPGKTDRRILMGGHLDSLNLEVDAATGRAPGANDDASGVAASLECARLMATKQWNHTLVFVGFTGEEQGLHGSQALAKRAKAEGWKLEAILNNDTVGSSSNKSGQKDEKHIRVFSEEYLPNSAATIQRHNSRELARYIEFVVRQQTKDFNVKLVLRRDRFGRGGDHTPFVEEGFDAVRFIEVHEEYTRQHTPDDLTEHMDWNYLANATKTNLRVLSALASAGDAPTDVRVRMDQSHDTTLTWKGTPGTKYVVYWRDTGSTTWNTAIPAGEVETFLVKGVNKDDHFFAVGAENGVPVAAR
ncbi:MAG TPA: M28 family metallopeptidase [Fimbriimonadaceae bacterium]|nr:M28 family metallopeptidase [Fimbriimonadaceae bacterium]